MTQYDTEFFIRKFEAIPEEQWTWGVFTDRNGAHCALGHLGVCAERTEIPPEAIALTDLFMQHIGTAVTLINDFEDRYRLPTPKQRILAALYEIRAKQDAAGDAFETRPLTLSKTEVGAL